MMSEKYTKIINENNLPNSIPTHEENQLFNDGLCFLEKNGLHSVKCIVCGFTLSTLHCKVESIKRECLTPKTKKEVHDQLVDSLPPFIIRYGRFGREFLKHIISGAKRRTEEEIKEIFNTYCLQCKPYYDAERGVCLKCSCNVNEDGVINKIAWKEQKCPVEKW